MIVLNISKLKLHCNYPEEKYFHWEKGIQVPIACTYIEMRNIWGKLIYRIERKGKELIMNGYTFVGNIDYLKIYRHNDPLIGSFKIQLFCSECGEAIYKLTGKLPLLIKIKTDFYVTKDTRKD